MFPSHDRGGAAPTEDGEVFGSGSHVLFVDKDTRTALNDSSYLAGDVDSADGFINGYQTTNYRVRILD